MRSRLRRRLDRARTYRRDLRRRARSLAVDALVVVSVLSVVAVAVLGAGYAIVFAVGGGGVPAVVGGWVAAFAFAVALPVVAMRLGSAVYGRLER